MIKKIIHIADLHFRTFKRHQEYREQSEKFFYEIDQMLTEYKSDEIRIAILGDLVHQKITISNELSMILSWFLNECAKRCKTIIIPGNHDLLEKNTDRLDSITPIVEMMRNENIFYLKNSICHLDDNIVWCPYSMLEENKRPDIEDSKDRYGIDKTYVGLFHGALSGSRTDLGFDIEGGDLTQFDGLDLVLLGDIHMRQTLKYKNISIVYSGSFIQQDFAESANRGHGYLVWDIESKDYTEYDIDNDYGFYTFKINSLEDIELEKEILVNK
jgi:DNA repair exonuclease SbcCD nuclease subunit